MQPVPATEFSFEMKKIKAGWLSLATTLKPVQKNTSHTSFTPTTMGKPGTGEEAHHKIRLTSALLQNFPTVNYC